MAFAITCGITFNYVCIYPLLQHFGQVSSRVALDENHPNLSVAKTIRTYLRIQHFISGKNNLIYAAVRYQFLLLLH